MNGPGDIPISNCTTERPCGFSLLPSLGMSCRGRAEAFARSLSSKLRTLGNSQNGESSPIHDDDDPIINGTGPNTWITHVDQSNQVVTALQPLRHTTSQETAADSFFDFDCEIESPGSPIDECEYSRLIETTSNTPHECATESGYICSSPVTTTSQASSQSSDGPYFDPISSDGEQISDATMKLQNGQIKDNLLTTTPVDGNDKNILSSNTNLNNNDNNTLDNNVILMNGHCTYEINDQDEVDFHRVAVNKQPIEHKITETNNYHNERDTNAANNVELNNEINKCNSDNMITHQTNNAYRNDQQKNDSVQLSQDEVNSSNSCSISSTNSDNVARLDQDTILDELHKISENDSNSINDQNCLNGSDNHQNEIIINEHNKLTLEISVQPATITQNDESQKLFNDNLQTIQQNEQQNNIQNSQNTLRVTKEDTDDDDDCRPQRVRRCSSLKTGKTPPGTPGRKKIVRFADVLGLDLADVKTFMDDIPNIPVSAYQDLEIIESEPPLQLGPRADKILMPLFQPPGSLPTFLDMVRDKQVNLENALVSDPINLTIIGTVRVRNLDFHKSVHIRYSSDTWRTFCDVPACYVANSCDGFSDKFTFTIYANSLSVGQRLEFAVRFQCKGQQFWDNNYGTNYCFQCLPVTNTPNSRQILPSHHITGSLLSPTSDSWCASFY